MVVALYNRLASVQVLLSQLATQSVSAGCFEVIVIDDGSAEPATSVLRAEAYPFDLTVRRQENQGPAAARHHGINIARAPLIIVIDDDMRVEPDFVAAHLAAHAAPSDAAESGPRVVLGRLRAPTGHALRLFERYQIAQLNRVAQAAALDPTTLRGGNVYTGNVSFPRALYEQVGGFDQSLRLSEDAELGIRFERAGATLQLSDAAGAAHASDHTELAKWIARSIDYGVADSRVAQKHADNSAANPWRFVFMVHPVSRVLLMAATIAPRAGQWLARAVLAIAHAVAAIGAERVAMAATTLAYGLLYYVGVRRAAGSASSAFAGMRRYLVQERPQALGRMGLLAKCIADIEADHTTLHATDARYRPNTPKRSVVGDAVQRIGLQILIAYRVMRLCRQLRFGLLARVISRLMRHLYSTDIHWDAELAPGIVIVHGIGLVISHAARVERGCVLFQHVTLGESIHAESRMIGSPTLESNVHVAPGAVLIGPIVIGRDSKIAANAVVSQSVPPRSVVESAGMVVRSRDAVASA